MLSNSFSNSIVYVSYLTITSLTNSALFFTVDYCSLHSCYVMSDVSYILSCSLMLSLIALITGNNMSDIVITTRLTRKLLNWPHRLCDWPDLKGHVLLWHDISYCDVMYNLTWPDLRFIKCDKTEYEVTGCISQRCGLYIWVMTKNKWLKRFQLSRVSELSCDTWHQGQTRTTATLPSAGKSHFPVEVFLSTTNWKETQRQTTYPVWPAKASGSPRRRGWSYCA